MDFDTKASKIICIIFSNENNFSNFFFQHTYADLNENKFQMYFVNSHESNFLSCN